MALAWKAGWVNALRGSNPLSSASPIVGIKERDGPMRFVPLLACNLLRGGVSERPKERASKARVGATSPWVQIPPPPPRGPDETRALRLRNPLTGCLRAPFRGVSSFARARPGLPLGVGQVRCAALAVGEFPLQRLEHVPLRGLGVAVVVDPELLTPHRLA